MTLNNGPRSQKRVLPPGVPADHPRVSGLFVADAGNTRALPAYLGHRNIQHTVPYTELSPTRHER
jgi:hypothetical protein